MAALAALAATYITRNANTLTTRSPDIADHFSKGFLIERERDIGITFSLTAGLEQERTRSQYALFLRAFL